jgi:hypothetical protein
MMNIASFGRLTIWLRTLRCQHVLCLSYTNRLHAYLRELVSVMSTSGALRFGRSVATGDWNAVIDEVAREVT